MKAIRLLRHLYTPHKKTNALQLVRKHKT